MQKSISRLAKYFWVQGRFQQIRAQIPKSCKILNYTQTLVRAYFKNNHFYQIQIVLADKDNSQRIQHAY